MAKKNGSGASGFRLLLEDQRQLADAIRRNDDLGKQNLSFLVGLVTVVVGGLVAVFIKLRGSLGDATFGLDEGTLIIMQGAMWGLLFFALLTYLRILQRGRISRAHERRLSDLRAELATLGDAPASYRTPLPDPRSWPFRIGALEMTALFCGFLLSLLLVLGGAAGSAAALGGVALAAVGVMLAQYR